MVIDANMYWFPEELFTDEEKSRAFMENVDPALNIRISLRENPETGLRQYTVEKPEGHENLNFVQGDYTLEHQLQALSESGTDKAVLKLSCLQEWLSLDACRVFNTKMAEHAARSGGKLFPLAVVPPDGSEESLRELDRCFDELGMTGVQVTAHYGNRYLDDPEFGQFFSYLNERKATVYVHHTPLPVQYDSLLDFTNLRRSYGRCVDQCTVIGRELFSGFFDRYPDVKMVHSMLGGGFFAYTSLWLPHKPKVQEAVSRFNDDNDRVRQQLHDNIYFEMSHAQPWGKEQLETAVRVLGADHIVYGTSYPVRPEWLMKGPEFVRNLDIAEEEKELLLHGNAERLYHLPV